MEPQDVTNIFRDLTPLAVIVMGVSGSGKSTVGKELADALACPFLEGDAFHTPQAVEKMRTGKPLTDEDRWPWLDRLGQAIDTETSHNGIAVAACSALKRAYRDRLRGVISAPVFFALLEGEREELRRRLVNRADHYMPASLLSSQIETLERPQPDETAIALNALQPPSVLQKQIVEWLHTKAHG